MGYILVTGCNGFIGREVTNSLIKNGYKVLGLSTGKSLIKSKEKYKHAKIDLTDCINVEKVFKENKIISVIHLAAIAHLKNRENIDWNTFYRVNSLASKNLFKYAAKYEANIFYASTVDVYGNNEKEQAISEDNATNPVSDYARSKYLAEKMLQKNSGDSNYIIARFAPVYGPSFMEDVYKRIYVKYPKIAFKIGKGYDYHFVSVNNIVDFVLTWVENSEEMTGIINVSDNKPINSLDFLELEKKHMNPKLIVYIPKSILVLMSKIIKAMSRVFPLNLFKKININLNKLIKPAKYSVKKMEKVYIPKWNLKNTIYKRSE